MLDDPFDETQPAFSPDGRWLAYASNESGRFEVYVRPFPSAEGKWQISTDGGTYPTWSPKRNELFSTTLPGADLVSMIEAAVTEKLERVEAKRLGKVKKP